MNSLAVNGIGGRHANRMLNVADFLSTGRNMECITLLDSLICKVLASFHNPIVSRYMYSTACMSIPKRHSIARRKLATLLLGWVGVCPHIFKHCVSEFKCKMPTKTNITQQCCRNQQSGWWNTLNSWGCEWNTELTEGWTIIDYWAKATYTMMNEYEKHIPVITCQLHQT